VIGTQWSGTIVCKTPTAATARQYEAKDRSGKRYRTEIVALQLRLLGNLANGNASKAEASDDIPF
jgi:hypothetical protein